MSPSRYPVPAGPHRVELELSRSRFIASVEPAATVAEAEAFVARIRTEFPDATHHCWAYLVGEPGSTRQVGCSDDGEPHGTAGKPMLGMLLHGGIGDVAAVVTRYYGGTKLGTGGLVRAYGGAVQDALRTLATVERVEWEPARLTVAYAELVLVQQLLEQHGAAIDERRFGEAVELDVRVPADRRAELARALGDATGGRVQLP